MTRIRQPPPQTLLQCTKSLVTLPFWITSVIIRSARIRILGHEEYYQHWPKPAAQSTRRERQNNSDGLPTNTELSPQNHEGLFGLPLEIRMMIYALVFPFHTIHLSKTIQKGSRTSKIGLVAYPCVSDWPIEKDCLCTCIHSPIGSRQITYHNSHRECRPRRVPGPLGRSPLPGQRKKDQDSRSGLWQLKGVMYASKAL